MKATFESECSWCSERICKGDEIKQFIHPISKTKSWIHEACELEAKDDGEDDFIVEEIK